MQKKADRTFLRYFLEISYFKFITVLDQHTTNNACKIVKYIGKTDFKYALYDFNVILKKEIKYETRQKTIYISLHLAQIIAT